MEFDIRQMDEAIENFITEQTKPFTLKTLVEELEQELGCGEDCREKLSESARLFLDNHQLIFHNLKTGEYFAREHFFSRKRFCVTPSAYELEQGILFPGHRFAPFCEEDVFASEIILLPPGKSEDAVLSYEVEISLEDAVAYHNLLGSEQMFNFFIADHQRNYAVVSAGDPSQKIILTVFDLKEFYQKNNFQNGDALIFTVVDWEAGEFRFEYLSTEKRDYENKKQWVQMLEYALEEVFNEHGDYLEIPEQFAQAIFKGDQKLISQPDASLDEFQSLSENVQIIMTGGRTYLGRRLDLGEEEELPVPDGVMISRGKTDSLEDMLPEVGCFLKKGEIQSYMLDELYQGNDSFDAFFDRCFGRFTIDFADEGQEVVFMNHLEHMWEQQQDSYNRFIDDRKGIVRSRILEVIDERIQWLLDFKDLSIQESDLPADLMENMTKSALHLEALLDIINVDDCLMSEDDIDQALNTIDSTSELQQNIMDQISEVLAGK